MVAPQIRLLGPVRVVSQAPTPPMWRRSREIITYLALHPGDTEDAFTEAIFPDERPSPKVRARRNEYLRIARRWLGDDEDGRPWLPVVRQGVYTLRDDVDVDLRTFQQLLGASLTTTSTRSLHAALDLVHGRPLSGIEDDRWDWAQATKTRLTYDVAQLVHELATRAERDGDLLLALRALETGLQVTPEDPRMWDRAVKVAKATGGDAAANAMARRRRRWAA